MADPNDDDAPEASSSPSEEKAAEAAMPAGDASPRDAAATEPAGQTTHEASGEADDEQYDDDDEEYDDEEYDDDDAPEEPAVTHSMATAPPAPRAMRGIELIGLSVLCIAMGAMLAGAALGVMTAAQTNPRPVVVASLAAATPANDADDDDDAGAATTDAASQEANPENTGDGVMDDLDDGPPPTVPTARPVLRAEVGAAGTPAPNGVDTHPSPAAANARAAAVPSERRRSGVVNSDSVPEGPAVGYAHGRAMRIYVERLDSKPVERHTAAAYRRMRDAAQRDHIALRIVSGFRTMEHQQALYRAYRLGRGNLAATPGHSNHQSGHALDLNTSSPGVFRWLTRNGRRFGFRRTVPTEPWHWEWW